MDSGTLLSLILLIVAFFVGILASIAAGVRLSFLQFKSSIAGYRVQMIAEATPKFIEAVRSQDYAGRLDRKYYASLGAILGEFARSFREEDFREDGPWPDLIQSNPEEKEWDIWQSFQKKVRPVMEDINVYAFVAGVPTPILFFLISRHDRKLLAQLAKLTELCKQIETVVGDLNAAFVGADHGARYEYAHGNIYPDKQGNREVAAQLIDGYRELHRIWTEWREMVGK
jgi:hypothetical protein